jgi:hypothetical protein
MREETCQIIAGKQAPMQVVESGLNRRQTRRSTCSWLPPDENAQAAYTVTDLLLLLSVCVLLGQDGTLGGLRVEACVGQGLVVPGPVRAAVTMMPAAAAPRREFPWWGESFEGQPLPRSGLRGTGTRTLKQFLVELQPAGETDG